MGGEYVSACCTSFPCEYCSVIGYMRYPQIKRGCSREPCHCVSFPNIWTLLYYQVTAPYHNACEAGLLIITRYRMLVQNAENDGWGCLRYWLGRRDAALRRRRPEKPCAQINYCSRSLSVHCQLFSVEPLSHPSGLLLRSVSSRRTVDAGRAQNHMWPGDAIAFNLVFVFVFSYVLRDS